MKMKRKVKKYDLCKCTNNHGVASGGPEAERLYRLCLVHSMSSLDLNSDFH